METASKENVSWLFEKALPRWAKAGVDAKTGFFFEEIDPKTLKATNRATRSRVLPRQVYSFVEAGRMGWEGNWQEIAERGLDWFVTHCKKPDGTFVSLIDADGTIVDDSFDLYNHAFALLGFASAADAFEDRRGKFVEQARTLLEILQDMIGHDPIGFKEQDPTAPLRANPHMHMFEAALALETVDEDGPWADLADDIAELAMEYFIDPMTGVLHEYFNIDWSIFEPVGGFKKGQCPVEPGHLFEWAWLLGRWSVSRGSADGLQSARRLYQVGVNFGHDIDRNAVIMGLNEELAVCDPLARLWGQTEWMKAAILLAEQSIGIEQDQYLLDILSANDALSSYIQDAPDGLWRDKMAADGTLMEEPAPASTFYHIICAISELHVFAQSFDADTKE
ncbi:MAG: AGE family epimerase/isomerase [Rhodobacteraceae bacterium]|nr:AGE family epimerase/isomerase [Paracoccaceae bacterium]